MFQEKIDGIRLLILPLANCRIPSADAALSQIRSSFPEVQTQLMRADRICGKEHLIFAARNAARAFSQPHRRARRLAVELLLYASCQRQISKAIQTLGVTPQTEEIVLAAFMSGKTPSRFTHEVTRVLQGVPDDRVIEVLSVKKAARLRKVYGVTKSELEAARLPEENWDSVLKRLIIERSALLAIEG